MMTNLDKYKLCIAMYREVGCWQYFRHKHHIKPKSLYPELANDYHNMVYVPDVVHWALHKWLLRHYEETDNILGIEKMSHNTFEDFINKSITKSGKFIDFKNYESEMLWHIERLVQKFLLAKHNKKMQMEKLSKTIFIFGGTKDNSCLRLCCSSWDVVPTKLLPLMTEIKNQPTNRGWTIWWKKFSIQAKDFPEFEQCCTEIGVPLVRSVILGRANKLGIGHLAEASFKEPRLPKTIRNQIMYVHNDFMNMFGAKSYDELDIDDDLVDKYITPQKELDIDNI